MSAVQILTPTRPALRWHGGKWLLAPWIIEHLPPHRVYVEPFGGAASVLIRKPRSYAEVYNDLDGEVVNLFRVMRDESTGRALRDALALTPFSRTEYDGAYVLAADPLERARRLVVRSFMGHGSDAPNINRPSGFRANSNKSGTTPARDWRNFPDALEATIERLRGVIIESRPALEIMAQHDSAETLHYLDPPYVHETRSRGRGEYVHEMSLADHATLLAFIQSVRGKVVLSGYPHPLYDTELTGWRRIERAALADGARARTEVLWMNPAATPHDLFTVSPKEGG